MIYAGGVCKICLRSVNFNLAEDSVNGTSDTDTAQPMPVPNVSYSGPDGSFKSRRRRRHFNPLHGTVPVSASIPIIILGRVTKNDINELLPVLI